jgi:hypothetical protein
MRQPIDTAPRDGTAIILEDDASGIYEVAHWLAGAGEWVGENGEPTPITPTHWQRIRRDQYLPRQDERSRNQSRVGRVRRLPVSSITVTLFVAALIVIFFRAEVTAYATRYAGREDVFGVVGGHDVQKAEAAKAARSFEEERKKAEALALEAAAARKELATSIEQLLQALDEERARSAELATALRENEKQAALLKASDETGQHKQAAAVRAEELRRSLQQEPARAAALAGELSRTQREIEVPEAQSRKADDVAAKLEHAESTIAQLRQPLQHERSRSPAMAREFASARRSIDERVTVGHAVEGQIVPATPTAAALPKPPIAGDLDKAEAARLIARASALIRQGNIGAARITLERAAESGDAEASFMLAQTYDPAILAAWGTYGTHGEAAKARELYAKALAGGILEAKERSDALRQ